MKEKKKKIGMVISKKMQKTAVVEVSRKVRHPLFQKYFYKRKKYKVHDEKDETLPGDRVLMMEHRPLSKEKRWKVVKVLERRTAP